MGIKRWGRTVWDTRSSHEDALISDLKKKTNGKLVKVCGDNADAKADPCTGQRSCLSPEEQKRVSYAVSWQNPVLNITLDLNSKKRKKLQERLILMFYRIRRILRPIAGKMQHDPAGHRFSFSAGTETSQLTRKEGNSQFCGDITKFYRLEMPNEF